MSEIARDQQTGISIRFIRQFDAEKEREESLKRWAEDMRAWRLLFLPCSETKQ